jgi:hypothetical protein
MYGFLMNSFEHPPEKPVKWSHIDICPEFTVWDYDVSSDMDINGNGRLIIVFSGSLHEIRINRSDDTPNISIPYFYIEPSNIAESDKDVTLKIILLNEGNRKGEGIRAKLSASRNCAGSLSAKQNLVL